MADLPPRSPWPKALAAGSALLIIGLLIGRYTKTGSGDYSGFWGGLTSPDGATEASAAEGLPACPTPKCLDAYLAPWCPHCRDAAPGIVSMREYLDKHNVHTNIIVGMDRPAALKAYAKQFGPDTLIDEQGALGAGGVPHFYVTDNQGHVLKEQAGVPQDIPDAKTFASLFGLP